MSNSPFQKTEASSNASLTSQPFLDPACHSCVSLPPTASSIHAPNDENNTSIEARIERLTAELADLKRTVESMQGDIMENLKWEVDKILAIKETEKKEARQKRKDEKEAGSGESSGSSGSFTTGDENRNWECTEEDQTAEDGDGSSSSSSSSEGSKPRRRRIPSPPGKPWKRLSPLSDQEIASLLQGYKDVEMDMTGKRLEKLRKELKDMSSEEMKEEGKKE